MLNPLSKSEARKKDTAAHGQALKHREERSLLDVPGADSLLHSGPEDLGLSSQGLSMFGILASWLLTGAALQAPMAVN